MHIECLNNHKLPNSKITILRLPCDMPVQAQRVTQRYNPSLALGGGGWLLMKERKY
jgi:hypothetical protein